MHLKSRIMRNAILSSNTKAYKQNLLSKKIMISIIISAISNISYVEKEISYEIKLNWNERD